MTATEIVPYLSVTDVREAVSYYSRVFDATPALLLNMPDGRVMHCEFRVGAARFFLSEELPEHGGTPSPASLGATSVAIHLYAEDCDSMLEQMTEHGAAGSYASNGHVLGRKICRVRDPFGHERGVTTKLREMTPEEIQASAAKMFKEIKG